MAKVVRSSGIRRSAKKWARRRSSLEDLETYQTVSFGSLHRDPYEHLHISHSEQVKHGGNKAFLSRAIFITLLSELKCASLSSQVAVYQPRSFSRQWIEFTDAST
jgi:hypothetical protein